MTRRTGRTLASGSAKVRIRDDIESLLRRQAGAVRVVDPIEECPVQTADAQCRAARLAATYRSRRGGGEAGAEAGEAGARAGAARVLATMESSGAPTRSGISTDLSWTCDQDVDLCTLGTPSRGVHRRSAPHRSGHPGQGGTGGPRDRPPVVVGRGEAYPAPRRVPRPTPLRRSRRRHRWGKGELAFPGRCVRPSPAAARA